MNKSLRNQLKRDSVELEDIGFSSKYISRTQRLVNRDGSFNIDRKGLNFSESFNLFHWLISIHWFKFIILVSISFIFVNLVFATLYYINGINNLGISENPTGIKAFLEAFFFSTQAITTVGFGRISPINLTANIIASAESLLGLLAFAIATGLLYGRFSKPFAKIIYSKYALIAPFKDITGFMFRTANKHKSQIIEAEVQIVFSRLENINGIEARKFYNIKLEYAKINFFSSTWTVNHPINEDSPLYEMTKEDLHKSEAEFLILLKGFDDTFAQTVHSRFSYRYDEIIWGAKFKNIHQINEDGKISVALDKIGDYEKIEINKPN
jgi:inward rectifier potassium channel